MGQLQHRNQMIDSENYQHQQNSMSFKNKSFCKQCQNIFESFSEYNHEQQMDGKSTFSEQGLEGLTSDRKNNQKQRVFIFKSSEKKVAKKEPNELRLSNRGNITIRQPEIRSPKMWSPEMRSLARSSNSYLNKSFNPKSAGLQSEDFSDLPAFLPQKSEGFNRMSLESAQQMISLRSNSDIKIRVGSDTSLKQSEQGEFFQALTPSFGDMGMNPEHLQKHREKNPSSPNVQRQLNFSKQSLEDDTTDYPNQFEGNMKKKKKKLLNFSGANLQSKNLKYSDQKEVNLNKKIRQSEKSVLFLEFSSEAQLESKVSPKKEFERVRIF